MKISVQDLYDKNACQEAVAFYDMAKLYNVDWAEVVTVEISNSPDWVMWLVERFATWITEIIGFRKMTYDAYGNMTSITYPDGRNVTYTYDAYGNKTSITYPDGEKHTYTYDAYGNMTSMTCPDGRKHTYTHDAYGNITSITYHDGRTHTYTYDRYGNKTSETCPDGRTYTYTPDMDVAGMWIKLTMDSGKIVTREVTE